MDRVGAIRSGPGANARSPAAVSTCVDGADATSVKTRACVQEIADMLTRNEPALVVVFLGSGDGFVQSFAVAEIAVAAEVLRQHRFAALALLLRGTPHGLRSE